MDPPNPREPDNRHHQRIASKARRCWSFIPPLGFIDPMSAESARAVYGAGLCPKATFVPVSRLKHGRVSRTLISPGNFAFTC